MCWSRCWCSASSSSRSASSSTASTSITSSRCARTRAQGGTGSMEFLLLLGAPLAGAAVLAVVGARRFAPELNVAFSLLTFLAACALTVRVIGEGNLIVAHDQFF